MNPSSSNPELLPPAQSLEQPQPFIATPERVSQYLELKTEEVKIQMKSADGRQVLFEQIMKHEELIRAEHADFHPEALRTQLDSVGEALHAEEEYLKNVQSPEKKNIFRRAWDAVKSFPKKHPIITTLIVIAAGVGALYYFGLIPSLPGLPGLGRGDELIPGPGAVGGEEMLPLPPPGMPEALSGEEFLRNAIQAGKDMAPSLDIRTVGTGQVEVGGRLFSAEEFAKHIGEMKDLPKDILVNVSRAPTSTPLVEDAIQEILQKNNLQQHWFE